MPLNKETRPIKQGLMWRIDKKMHGPVSIHCLKALRAPSNKTKLGYLLLPERKTHSENSCFKEISKWSLTFFLFFHFFYWWVYADDIALLANAPVQAKSRLYSLKQASAGIGLYVNAYKIEYMYFNQTGDISTRNCCSLKN